MADPDQDINNTDNPGPSVATTLQITVAVVIINFILLIFILILYVRAKLLRQRPSSRSGRLVFAPYEASTPRRALDISILNSIPITVFQSKDLKQESEDSLIECAVCISELKDREEVRFLPNCKHGFHVECIDMWFHSNDTCPLCRSSVTRFENPVEISVKDLRMKSELGGSSSNLAVRKRKEGMLVIDIPKPSTSFGLSSSRGTPLTSSKMPSDSPLPTSRLLEETKTPVSGRMKSLKGLVSRVSFKGVGSFSSSRYDIEQGGEEARQWMER